MIKVAEWGTGMMGQGLLGFILDRPKDIDLVGVIVTNPAKEGKTVVELLGRPCDVKMTTDFEAILAKKPDVVCINTQSNLDEIEPQIVPAASNRPRLALFTNCTNTAIKDLHLQNQAVWCLHILYSEDVTVDGVNITADHNIPSSDGIDIDSSRRVRNLKVVYGFCRAPRF